MYGALLSISHSEFWGIQVDTKNGKNLQLNARTKSFKINKYFLGDSDAQLLHW
jgi:hypothetical protein